jgi:glycosyltransferase involved in cell wall biosynthesis
MAITVAQLLPELEVGGVEQGTLEIAEALVAAGYRALVISAGGQLVPKLEAAGAQHIKLPIGQKRLSTLRLIRRLREIFLAERVDVVHARSRLPAWIARFALRGMHTSSRPRWVTTVHGPYTVNCYSRIMVSGERVIAISDFIRDYIFRHYPTIAPERVVVIPRGVDRARYNYSYKPSDTWLTTWRREHPALDGSLVLSLPARLTRWKGQEDFIELIALLRAENMPVHGLIVGGPHPRNIAFADELRALVQRKGLSQHVSFLGQRRDMREILSISDFTFSLTLEPEAFGRTTIEALSVGCPVIGYDHGGTGEILRQVYPAGLVKTRNVEAAVRRIKELSSNPIVVPREHRYTLSAMQQATLGVYQSLMAP